MKYLVLQITLYFTLSLVPLLGIESEQNGCILVISVVNSETTKTTENNYKFEIFYGSENSAKKTLKMLIAPSKYFNTYKCESIIVVRNGQKIKERLNGSIAKIVKNCDSDLNLFFVRSGKTNLGNVSIDVTDLKNQKRRNLSEID